MNLLSVELCPLLLPDPKDADRDVWLDNWLHILSIAYSRWNGFVDCLVENMALYLSVCEDEAIVEMLWLLTRKLFSHSFYGMAFEVVLFTVIECRKERNGKMMMCILMMNCVY